MPLKITQNSPPPSDLAARARELAAHAEALASAINALQHDIRAAQDQSVRRAGLRCDDAIGCAREAAGELRGTAVDLNHSQPPLCLAPVRSRGRVPRTRQHP